MKTQRKTTVAVLLAVLFTWPGVSYVEAQIPETFENLQVLPKDISRGELVGEMRALAGALGLRCHHCHVGEEGNTLAGFDFASDEKPRKKTARVMMRMVEEINSELLPKIGKERSELLRVRCITCHHGQTRPRTLQDVLAEEIEARGVDAAIDKYRELREEYYGSATFDFTEWRLLNVSEPLGREGRFEEARRILELNLEFFPDSGMTHFRLGQVHARLEAKAKALIHLRRALELMPENAAQIEPLIKRLEQ